MVRGFVLFALGDSIGTFSPIRELRNTIGISHGQRCAKEVRLPMWVFTVERNSTLARRREWLTVVLAIFTLLRGDTAEIYAKRKRSVRTRSMYPVSNERINGLAALLVTSHTSDGSRSTGPFHFDKIIRIWRLFDRSLIYVENLSLKNDNYVEKCYRSAYWSIFLLLLLLCKSHRESGACFLVEFYLE